MTTVREQGGEERDGFFFDGDDVEQSDPRFTFSEKGSVALDAPKSRTSDPRNWER